VERLACISVDLDGLVHYARLHGLGEEAVPEVARELVYRRAVPRFLDLLGAAGARGTLFVIGAEAEGAPARDSLIRALEQGHEVGNHSHAHDYALSRRSGGEIARDLSAAEHVLQAMGMPRPVGFRAPGYTLSPQLLQALVEAGYRYDASMFPAAPYWLAKATALGWMRLRRRTSVSILDSPRVLLAPRGPYRPELARPWRRGQAPLIELPISVTPALRLPFIGGFVALAPTPLLRAGYAALARGTFVSLELHAVDLLGPEDGLPPALCRLQPDLGLPLQRKLDRLGTVLGWLGRDFRCLPLAEAALAFA
jgi:peptidoglycan/xylan/chitin deacetylase (PgdA/CDA1 family)